MIVVRARNSPQLSTASMEGGKISLLVGDGDLMLDTILVE